MKKLAYLESLRGLAALVVVFSHFVLAFYPALFWGKAEQAHMAGGVEVFLSGTPINIFYNGSFSVSIFFVLSGFVLSYRFFRDRDEPAPLLPLAIKRYVRLLLPVLFSNGIAFLLLSGNCFYHVPAGQLAKSSDWFGGFWQFRPDVWMMLRESFFGAFFANQSAYNNVLWTMTYEFYGSLIVFAFVAFFRNHRRRAVVYIVLMLVFRRTYYLAFVLGILLSDWHSSEGNFFKKASTRSLLIALLAGLFVGSAPMFRPLDGTVYAFLQSVARTRTWHVLGAFLVMAAILHLPRLQGLLSKKPFVFLGKISFSQYILHFLIISSLSSWLMLALAARIPYHAAFVITFGVSLPLIMAVSYGVYLLVDTGGIRLSQAVYQSIRTVWRKHEPRPAIGSESS